MKIRAAVVSDGPLLRELVMAAKANWGYSPDQMESWRSSLAVTDEQLTSQPAFVAQEDSVFGFYTLRLDCGKCDMDNLWVLPSEMSNGYGRALLAHACEVARVLGAKEIRIDADPNAMGFYVKCGAVMTGSLPAPIDGQPSRVRPQLVLSTT